jgi:TonB family protein
MPRFLPSQEVEAHLVHRVEPVKPNSTEALQIGGSVNLQVTISTSGLVTSVRPISGHPLLAQAAIEAVRQWKYRPFFDDGVPIEVTTVLTLDLRPATTRTRQRFIPYLILAIPWALLCFAWRIWRRSSHAQAFTWREKFVLSALLILSISLVQLTAEFIYRFGLGRFWPPVMTIATWNAYSCMAAALLAVIGKGPGRVLSLLAAPLLIFIWGIHVSG